MTCKLLLQVHVYEDIDLIIEQDKEYLHINHDDNIIVTRLKNWILCLYLGIKKRKTHIQHMEVNQLANSARRNQKVGNSIEKDITDNYILSWKYPEKKLDKV